MPPDRPNPRPSPGPGSWKTPFPPNRFPFPVCPPPRGGQHVAFLQPALVEQLQRFPGAAELGARDRDPRRAILLPDIDHLHGGLQPAVAELLVVLPVEVTHFVHQGIADLAAKLVVV